MRQAAYWKAMHGRALEREAQLKSRSSGLRPYSAREQQLFGRKTETSAATAPAASDASHADSPPRQPRGQQRGRPSRKRRDYSHLPDIVEDKVLPPDQCRCSRCGQPFADFPGTEDSTILEIESGPSPSHSPSPLSTDLLVWCSSRHRTAPPPAG